jgi:serine/threonine-protein kinase
MQKDDVEAYLQSYGYELGNVKTITSPEDEGKVLEQSPVAGSTLDKESTVDIVVSDGKGVEKGTVPSVTRMSLDDAKKAINAAGFEVGNISYDWNESIGKGYVTWQQWTAGYTLEKGTAIDLEVSSGPEPEPEPSSGQDSQGGNENNDG